MSVSDHLTNIEDSIKDMSIAATFVSMLTQASESVYDVALKRVKDYVSGRILEAKIAGRIAAGLVRSLCKVT